MKRTKLTVALVVAAVLATAAFVALRPDDQPVAVTRTQQVSLDHQIYANAKELKVESDLVIRGTVLDSGQSITSAPLVAEDGQEIPSTPVTEFQVAVTKIFKGNLDTDQITVVLTGGVAGDTRYEPVGMPWLAKQKKYIM